jgi:hypothetical protein
MDPLILTVKQTLSRDVQDLVHAVELEEPMLQEMEPPNWHWGLPLGFASLAAAGALLIAAAGVQETVGEQQHMMHARRAPTKLHMKKLVAQSTPWADNY